MAKKDMRSPVRVTSSSNHHSDLKHKGSLGNSSSSTSSRPKSKALFSPSPHAKTAGYEDSDHMYVETNDETEEANVGAGSNGHHVYFATAGASAGAGGGTYSHAHTHTHIATPNKDMNTDSSTSSSSTSDIHSPSGHHTTDSTSTGSSGNTSTIASSVTVGTTTTVAAADDDDDFDGIEETDEGVFNPYLFMSDLPPLNTIERNGVNIPPIAAEDRGKPTLVLDLDETLVHCTVEPVEKADMTFPVTFNGVLYDVYVSDMMLFPLSVYRRESTPM